MYNKNSFKEPILRSTRRIDGAFLFSLSWFGKETFSPFHRKIKRTKERIDRDKKKEREAGLALSRARFDSHRRDAAKEEKIPLARAKDAAAANAQPSAAGKKRGRRSALVPSLSRVRVARDGDDRLHRGRTRFKVHKVYGRSEKNERHWQSQRAQERCPNDLRERGGLRRRETSERREKANRDGTASVRRIRSSDPEEER